MAHVHRPTVRIDVQESGDRFVVLILVQERVLRPGSGANETVEHRKWNGHYEDGRQGIDQQDNQCKADVPGRPPKQSFPHGPVLRFGKEAKAVEIERVSGELIGKKLEEVVHHAQTVVGKKTLGVFRAIGEGVMHLNVTGSRKLWNVAGQCTERVFQVMIEAAEGGFASPLFPGQVRFRVQAAKHTGKELESGTIEKNVVDTRLVQAEIAIAMQNHVNGCRPYDDRDVDSVENLEPISAISKNFKSEGSDKAWFHRQERLW